MLVSLVRNLQIFFEKRNCRYVFYDLRKRAAKGVSLLCSVERHGLIQSREHLIDKIGLISLNGEDCQTARIKELLELRVFPGELTIRQSCSLDFLVM